MTTVLPPHDVVGYVVGFGGIVVMAVVVVAMFIRASRSEA